MRKVLITGAAFAVLAGGPAFAADVPLKAPARAPAPVVESWTGIYLGGEVGGMWSQADWTTTCFTVNSGPSSVCGTPLNLAIFPVDSSSPHRFNGTALRAGGYVGVNWQVQPSWLIGVEVDAAWADHKETVTGIVGCSISTSTCGSNVNGTNVDTSSVRTIADASIRGRLGFIAMPNVLVYGTGGLALADVETNVTCNTVSSPWCGGTPGVISSTFTNNLMPGWTAGGGLEYKWGAWLLRGEYRFSEYKSVEQRFFIGSGNEIRANLHLVTQTAMFGVSYLFGAPAAPIAARY